MPWFKIRNIDTRTDFAINEHVQRFTDKAMAKQYRDKLIGETGQRFKVYAFYPPTVGNLKGGKPKD